MWCESEGGCIVPYRHQLQHGLWFSSLLLWFLFCLQKPKKQKWLRCDFIKDELCKQTGERPSERIKEPCEEQEEYLRGREGGEEIMK